MEANYGGRRSYYLVSQSRGRRRGGDSANGTLQTRASPCTTSAYEGQTDVALRFFRTERALHQQGAGYEVEFTTLSGGTVAVVTLDASDVRPVEAREIVHARPVS